MAYDVSDHLLLGAAAKALAQDDAFGEHQEWAEEQLGVAGTSYTGRSRRLVERAIALQVNWQLALPKDIWFTRQVSSSQSKQNVTYRDAVVWIDPRAVELVALAEQEANVGSRYGDIRSIR